MYPQLSTAEQEARWKLLQKTVIYPLSTQWAVTIDGTTYDIADASTLGQYTTNILTQNQAYGLVGLRLTNFLKTITDCLVIAVSYSNIFTVANTAAMPTVPDDSGQVIYRACITQSQFNETIWFKNGPSPDNHFVEANRPIYIHQWAPTATISAANMVTQGFLTLYAEFTGIRT